MDLIQQFNQELQSIQPPISKQKMMKITKLAIKNIKLYKHIVQCVEKYISKCTNSLKLSSLYVIDAIVRQSIYRFKDKDVYAARFARNFNQTFQYIFHSAPTNDKPKIVRVLNLWQRNGVFSADTIQPLLDLPNRNNLAPIEPHSMSADSPQTPLNQSTDESNMLLIQQIANTLALVKGANKTSEGQHSSYDHHGRNSNTNNNSTNNQGTGSSNQTRFNKGLMDFDYDDRTEANGDETPTEAEPPLSTTLSKIEMEQRNKNDYSHNSSETRLDSNQHQMTKVAQNILSMPAILERWQKLQAQHLIVDDQAPNRLDSIDDVPVDNKNARTSRAHEASTSQYDHQPERSKRNRSRSRSSSSSNHHRARYYDRDNEPNSQSGSLSPTNKRNRSHRSRSISPSRIESNNPVSFENDRAADRRRRGLPAIRKNCLTICSTTLWLGHVPKTVSEADISDAFGEFGTITSIDLIPPRGCAYVCMDRRQDAYKALNDLGNLRLSGSLIKMAWAPGKGLKDKEFKDYWEVNVGASFIPYNKLRPDLNIDILEEGGVIDEDTMTDDLKRIKIQKERDREELARVASDQLASLLPLPIVGLGGPSQVPPSFPIPPNLSVPPPSLTSIQLPSMHRGIVLGDNLNEIGDRDNRNIEQSSFTENSLSPSRDQVPLTLPPMSIPPPPIFNHAPPPFGLPPPPIGCQPSVPPLPNIFQNPPPSLGQVPRLPFSTQPDNIEDSDNRDVEDHQHSERDQHQTQSEYDDHEESQNHEEDTYQQGYQNDQQHPQIQNGPQQASLMHPHIGFQSNPNMIPHDDSFNFQMMTNAGPMMHPNRVTHPHQQQFSEYDQHGHHNQGRLLPVSEDKNLPHDFMTNQTNSLYDFNCNPVMGGMLNNPLPGYGSMRFGYDEFDVNGPPNGTNRWTGPPRGPGFIPRHVQRNRNGRNNGRGRERQLR